MPLNELDKFTLDDYLGIKINNGAISFTGNGMQDPRYGDMTSYPDSLIMGDSLFPMLYVYYMGENANKNKVGDPLLMEQGLKDYFSGVYSLRGNTQAVTQVSAPGSEDTAEMKRFKTNLPKYYKMLVSAVGKNSNYVWQLNNATANLMAQYKTRLPQNRGSYYSSDDQKSYDYFPILSSKSTNSLSNCMESLRLLYENGVIDSDQSLGIRPLNLYDGTFATEQEDFTKMRDIAKVLGLPTQGIFTINNRPQRDYMFKTFSGIDIIALASLNTTVTQLNGMTSISWSIHRGMSVNRTLGKANAPGRGRGGRTVAGTMIFTLADHHPLLELLPGDYPITSAGNLSKDPDLWRPMLLSDQIAPFDLVVTMTNEYGHASIVSLYGIEIVDEGTVIGMDNLITELVCQYVAVSMDPIMAAQVDEYGNIDPYGLLQGGYSRMYKNREMVIQGVAYSDLEQAYEAQYDGIFGALENRISLARNYQQRTAENLARKQEEDEEENNNEG